MKIHFLEIKLIIFAVLLSACTTAPKPSPLSVIATPTPTKKLDVPEYEKIIPRLQLKTSLIKAFSGSLKKVSRQNHKYFPLSNQLEPMSDYPEVLLNQTSILVNGSSGLNNHLLFENWSSNEQLLLSEAIPGSNISECHTQTKEEPTQKSCSFFTPLHSKELMLALVGIVEIPKDYRKISLEQDKEHGKKTLRILLANWQELRIRLNQFEDIEEAELVWAEAGHHTNGPWYSIWRMQFEGYRTISSSETLPLVGQIRTPEQISLYITTQTDQEKQVQNQTKYLFIVDPVNPIALQKPKVALQIPLALQLLQELQKETNLVSKIAAQQLTFSEGSCNREITHDFRRAPCKPKGKTRQYNSISIEGNPIASSFAIMTSVLGSNYKASLQGQEVQNYSISIDKGPAQNRYNPTHLSAKELSSLFLGTLPIPKYISISAQKDPENPAQYRLTLVNEQSQTLEIIFGPNRHVRSASLSWQKEGKGSHIPIWQIIIHHEQDPPPPKDRQITYPTGFEIYGTDAWSEKEVTQTKIQVSSIKDISVSH